MFKKINFKKVFSVLFWIVVVSGLITALGFVNVKEKQVKGKGVQVNVDYSSGNQFVDSEDIMQFMRDRNDTVVGKRMDQININHLEKALLTHPAISGAQVSATIDGLVKIDVKQRLPIVRVFLPTGESFYIDNQAKLMPLSENYTAKVIVAGGNIWEPYDKMCNYNLRETGENKFLGPAFVLDDIYRLSDYISNDTLLSALIHQINVNDKKEIELYPAIGDHKIIFGSAEDIMKKFEKLKIFYTEGINCVDGWSKYSVINLKYEGQVVCTKKVQNTAVH